MVMLSRGISRGISPGKSMMVRNEPVANDA